MSSPAPTHLDPGEPTLNPSEGQRSLPAFLISGILLSFLGAILPAWRYHLRPNFTEVGDYFLSLGLGLLFSVGVAHWLWRRRGVKFILILGSAVSCAAFLALALSSPPVAAMWRMWGVLGIGIRNRPVERGSVPGHIAAVSERSRRHREHGRRAFRSWVSAHGIAGGRDVLRLYRAEHPDSVRTGSGFLRRHLRQGQVCRIARRFPRCLWRRCGAIFRIRARFCSACCCSSSSAMNGRSRAGCRCF